MPTGGLHPHPKRTGGGAPLLQRVVESLDQQRGTGIDTSPQSPAHAENMAMARAITAMWGTNGRLANQSDPDRMTGTCLSRWEKILGIPVNPLDPDTVRRARVKTIRARIGVRQAIQSMNDALVAALGAVFVQIELLTPATANTQWPIAPSSDASTTIGAASNGVTLPTPSIRLADASLFPAPGIALITTDKGIQIVPYTGIPLPGQAIAPNTLYGCSGGAGVLATGNAVLHTAVPWYSTIAHILIKTQKTPGMSEQQYYDAVAKVAPLMDQIAPAWTTFDWYRVDATAGVKGFYLDAVHNLDNDVFDV
jgi:hypothetical protein